MLATWIMPSSIDRAMPMVTASLGLGNFTTELINHSGAFGLHLLRPDQTTLAFDFGTRSGRAVDKFANLKTTASPAGSPLLADCLAALDCRLLRKIEIADRLCIWAEIVSGNLLAEGNPLTERTLLAAATTEQGEVLRTQLQRDAQYQRAAWLAMLGR